MIRVHSHVETSPLLALQRWSSHDPASNSIACRRNLMRRSISWNRRTCCNACAGPRRRSTDEFWDRRHHGNRLDRYRFGTRRWNCLCDCVWPSARLGANQGIALQHLISRSANSFAADRSARGNCRVRRSSTIGHDVFLAALCWLRINFGEHFGSPKSAATRRGSDVSHRTAQLSLLRSQQLLILL
jgi:hypothetical protein